MSLFDQMNFHHEASFYPSQGPLAVPESGSTQSMETPIILKMPTGDLVLIYSDGRVLFIEPDGEVVEPHPCG